MAMGVGGQGGRLLLCNRGELQTLNVEWRSGGAVVYQTTLTDLCSAYKLILARKGIQSTIFSAKEVTRMSEKYLEVISDNIFHCIG